MHSVVKEWVCWNLEPEAVNGAEVYILLDRGDSKGFKVRDKKVWLTDVSQVLVCAAFRTLLNLSWVEEEKVKLSLIILWDDIYFTLKQMGHRQIYASKIKRSYSMAYILDVFSFQTSTECGAVGAVLHFKTMFEAMHLLQSLISPIRVHFCAQKDM